MPIFFSFSFLFPFHFVSFCLFSQDFLFLCQLAWWLYRTTNRLERRDTRGLPVWRLGQGVSVRRVSFSVKLVLRLALLDSIDCERKQLEALYHHDKSFRWEGWKGWQPRGLARQVSIVSIGPFSR
ncbi:hypothetical protein V8C26DRAFT_21762 [Trichoderma gracile]